MKILSLLIGTLLAGSSIAAFAQPANDNFENPLIVTTSPIIGSNVGATEQIGEPQTIAGQGSERTALGGRSVWFQWTAPQTGSFTVKTGDRSGVQQSSNFDTQIGIFTGTALANLVEVASNDDDINFQGGLSSVNFNATGGQTYFILLDGFDGATGTYALYVAPTRFTLSVQPFPQGRGTVALDPAFDPQGYVAGTVVTLQALPNDGERFFGWTGATNSSNPTINVVMNSDKALVAHFSFDHRLLWQNTTNGNILAWNMSTTNFLNRQNLTSVPRGWKLLSAEDLDKNGTADLILQHRDRRVTAKMMDGDEITNSISLGRARPGYEFVGAGDFNRDGQDDLVFQRTNGPVQIFLMNNLVRANTNIANFRKIGAGWKVKAIADMNSDASADIVFQHRDGRVSIWLMDGSTKVESFATGTSSWILEDALDVDNDTNPDLIFTNLGRPGAWLMKGTDVSASIEFGNGQRQTPPWRLGAATK